MNKEQAVEFVVFLKEHLFHSSYKESRDRPQIEELFDNVETKPFELKLPNEDDPDHPIITEEQRVSFKPIYEAVYS